MPSPRLNLAEVLLGPPMRSDQIAVREPGRWWTYGELSARVAKIGGGLLSLGVRPGDRVAVLMPDGLDAVASILGTIWIGAIATPLSELCHPIDLRDLVKDSGATVALVHGGLEPGFDEVRREMDSLREVLVLGPARGSEKVLEDLLVQAEPARPADTQADDPALLVYGTSCDGAAPRGVLHAHEAPLASFRLYAQGVLAISENDRVFSAAKLATPFGFGAGLVFPLAAGAQAIYLPLQPKTRNVLELLRSFRPTVMFASPSLYGQLVEDTEPNPPAAALMSSLRACVAGSESLPATLASRVKDRLGVDVLASYGLAEAFHSVLANTPSAQRRGSSGLVVPGYRARVVDEEGQEVRENQIGTLELAGPSLALGYWNQKQETEATFRNQWLHTGDRFLVDQDGFLFHCGRADEFFKVGGKWVSPIEVERTLLLHEAVWECAVVGAEDADGLIKPYAYVVTNVGHEPGAELEQELIDFVKQAIAPYKYPRWIEFVDQLPKGPHGKVLRFKLMPKPGKRRRTSTTLPG
ncbi:MAG: benzoate-CoA ligase family protein [Deltaproteobacteria bacterium]|nr:benzoate-CoA ligase family protein [Deltaproteobacteria bacterium]